MTTSRRAAWLIGALIWSAAGSALLACPICFQVEQGPVTDGVRAAVFVLMGVTVAVLSGVAVFVRRLVRASNPPSPSASARQALPNPTNPTNLSNLSNPV